MKSPRRSERMTSMISSRRGSRSSARATSGAASTPTCLVSAPGAPTKPVDGLGGRRSIKRRAPESRAGAGAGECAGSYPWRVAKVIEKRPDGTTVVIVPAADAGDLEVGALVEVSPAPKRVNGQQPWPFGALAGKYPPFEIEEIKAARREALLGKAE